MEIEGKRIKYIGYNGAMNAIVVNCDEDIGITIVSADVPDYYLFCMHGPSSPYYKACRYKLSKKNSKKLFKVIYDMIIKDGIFDCDVFHKTVLKYASPEMRMFIACVATKKPDSEYCAFNQ